MVDLSLKVGARIEQIENNFNRGDRHEVVAGASPATTGHEAVLTGIRP
jgi:hypothetical protein